MRRLGGMMAQGGLLGMTRGPLSSYLLRDTFTDADGTPLGSHAMDVGGGWTVHTGAAEVRSGRARTDSTAFTSATADAGRADVTVSATLGVLAAPAGIYMLLRWADANNFWMLYIVPGANWLLIEKSAGANTMRASGSAPAEGDRVVTATLSGQQISATWGGANLISYGSASAHQSATRFGIGGDTSAGQTFDDFAVTP